MARTHLCDDAYCNDPVSRRESGEQVMSQDTNVVGTLACIYHDAPVMRALLQLIPNWAVADTLLQQRVNEIRSDRVRTFFDELGQGRNELSDDLIQKEEFLHRYFCTLRAAVNTRQREKIRLLARLLKNSMADDMPSATDEFEEQLAALEAITLREFSVLRCLRELETANPQTPGENELQNANRYWHSFKMQSMKTCSISEDSFAAFMARLERTGLYLRITGAFLDYTGDVGRTTPLFARLLCFISNSEIEHSPARGSHRPQ